MQRTRRFPLLLQAALFAALLSFSLAGISQQVPRAATAAPAKAASPAVDNTVPKMPEKPVSMDLSAIDKTADPCSDFYTYACGNWTKTHAIPADQASWGRFQTLDEYNLYSLYQLLEQAANHPATPLQTKYGNYYESCMNTALSDQMGAKPIEPVLEQIGAWKNKAELPALLGTLENQRGYGFLYGFGAEPDQKNSTVYIATLNQGGLSLPDRDYYLQDDAHMKEIRAKFVEHVTKMFVLLGDTPEKAATEAKAVMEFETSLAKPSMAREDQRDPDNVYHMTKLSELQTSTPSFQWSAYFSQIHVPVSTLNVAEPKFFAGLDAALAKASIPEMQSYLRWHVLDTNASRLGKAFDEENFRFQAVLTGQAQQQPQWKRCTRSTDAVLGEALGQDWVAKYYPPTAKAQMDELIKNLETALGQDLQGLDWMTPQTKAEAQKKLAAFRQKVGYPETWRDYSSLEIKRDDRVGNAERSAVYEDRRNLNKLGKPVDEKEWEMSPPTVNAYYNPPQNDINFPAGILQPPFFDPGVDAPVNYGAIGVVIGHEMTHGFDDEGSKYDAQGNVRTWWTPADKAAFDQRTQCTAKEYGSFEAVAGEKLNGKLTLGENTADNGGLRIAYAALHSEIDGKPAAGKTADGYTPDQRFFLGFAQVWCENTRDQMARMLVKVDPHSPGRFRVNGTVQNFDKFAQAFQCKKGSAMYPEASCRTW